MRNKVSKMFRGIARLAADPKKNGFEQGHDGVVRHTPGSYRAIYKGLKDSYKRRRRDNG